MHPLLSATSSMLLKSTAGTLVTLTRRPLVRKLPTQMIASGLEITVLGVPISVGLKQDVTIPSD